MEVVPQELCRLADECMKASIEVSDGWSGKQASFVVDSRAAGNTDGGSAVVKAHCELAEAAETAVGRLVSVLEQDMDDLYLCAFAYSCTDEASASRLESTFPKFPFFTGGR
jgi:hypothetical protein